MCTHTTEERDVRRHGKINTKKSDNITVAVGRKLFQSKFLLNRRSLPINRIATISIAYINLCENINLMYRITNEY